MYARRFKAVEVIVCVLIGRQLRSELQAVLLDVVGIKARRYGGNDPMQIFAFNKIEAGFIIKCFKYFRPESFKTSGQ